MYYTYIICLTFRSTSKLYLSNIAEEFVAIQVDLEISGYRHSK